MLLLEHSIFILGSQTVFLKLVESVTIVEGDTLPPLLLNHGQTVNNTTS